MTKRILVMGLPGSGKTTLAQALRDALCAKNQSVDWFNADTVRETYQDWDFTTQGRLRQSIRMRELADSCGTDWVIADFVAPLKQMRDNYAPDVVVWMDTITQGRFADTNAAFIPPETYTVRVTEHSDSRLLAESIVDKYLHVATTLLF